MKKKMQIRYLVSAKGLAIIQQYISTAVLEWPSMVLEWYCLCWQEQIQLRHM